MTSTEMSPAERIFGVHLAGAPYRSGEREGLWRLKTSEFPLAVFEFSAAPRAAAPDAFTLRFDLSGYADAPPTAAPWDVERGGPLAPGFWPTGGRLVQIFNPDWKREALYWPLDREALVGHEAWLTEHAGHTWNPREGIVQYLRAVSELLHSNEYSGVRGG
jgi:hypothetical protein